MCLRTCLDKKKTFLLFGGINVFVCACVCGSVNVLILSILMYACSRYAVTGIVLYAMAVGVCSEKIIKTITIYIIAQQGKLQFSADEAHDLREKMFRGRREINFDTFLHFTLLKTKRITMQDVQDIEAAWNKLNFDGDETLTLEEMYSAHLFDIADKNGDGTLNFEEFAAMCELIISKQGYDADLQGIIVPILLNRFAEDDEDGDGNIDKCEFVKFVTRSSVVLYRCAETMKVFDAADTDGSKTLSHAELQMLCSTHFPGRYTSAEIDQQFPAGPGSDLSRAQFLRWWFATMGTQQKGWLSAELSSAQQHEFESSFQPLLFKNLVHL